MSSLITQLIKNKFAKASLVLVLIQAFTLIISFFGNILLAGIYKEPSGFGAFNYYFSLITTFGFSACFGLDTYLLKKNTELRISGDLGSISSLISKSYRITLISSMMLAIVVVGSITDLFTHASSIHLIVGLGIIFTAILVVRSYALRSLGELMFSNFFNQSGKTLLFYVFIVVFYLTQCHGSLNIGIISFIAATIVCWLCIEVKLYKRRLPYTVQHDGYTYKYLLAAGFPFFIYDVVGNIASNVDIFYIEKTVGHHFLGIYSFYKKISSVPFIALAVVGSVIQTQYLEVYKKHDTIKLQQMVFKTNRLLLGFSVLATISILLCYYVFSTNIEIFQSAFSKYRGYESCLYILCVGEVLASAFGPQNYFMLMLGYEKASIVIDIMFCIGIILLGWMFFHLWGYTGFASAYLICRIVKGCVIWLHIKRHSGISFFVF